MENKTDLPAMPENRFLGMLAGFAIVLANRDSEDEAFPYRAGELVVARGDKAYYVRQPGMLALIYALNLLKRQEHADARKAYEAIEEAATAFIEDSAYPIDFPGWSVFDLANLEDDCSSNTLYIPFSKEEFEVYENWLELSLGEMVFYELPELWPQMLTDVKQGLSFAFEQQCIDGHMCNVTAPPPDFPAMWEHRCLRAEVTFCETKQNPTMQFGNHR